MKNRFLNNTSWIIGGNIFRMVISLFIGMITARYLGPSNYGILTYSASFVTFFTAISTLGLNNIIVKELLENKKNEGEVLGTAIGLRIISSLISVISIVSIICMLNTGEPLILISAFLQAISLLLQSVELIDYWYQSRLQSKISTLVISFAYVIMVIYKIIILILEKNVLWFAFASTLDYIVIALLLLITYFKNKTQKLSFSIKRGHDLLKKSYHFILSGLMVAVYGQMDKIMIGKMLDATAVGYYSTATAICGMWTFVLAAIIQSATPLIVEAKQISETLYKKRIRQLYAAVIWISFTVSIIFSLFAKWIVLILYGEAYLPSVVPLVIITWYTAFSYLGVARGIWLVIEEKQRYEKILSGYGALCNLIMNFLFIPLWGINGAAIATLLTQIITNFILLFWFKELRENSYYILQGFLLKDIGILAILKKIKNKINR